jgi:vancomycin resistance protein YoaR
MTTLTKKKLSLAEAADQWEHAKLEMEALKPQLEEAAEVLKAHFEKTGRTSYKDRIAYVTGSPKLVLDQEKIRAFLGKRLGEFQKRTAPSKSLSLLK